LLSNSLKYAPRIGIKTRLDHVTPKVPWIGSLEGSLIDESSNLTARCEHESRRIVCKGLRWSERI